MHPFGSQVRRAIPSPQPPFAGKSSWLAESLMHSSGGDPILALGQGNSPSGGQHGGAANIFTEPEIDCGSDPPRTRPRNSFCQPRWAAATVSNFAGISMHEGLGVLPALGLAGLHALQAYTFDRPVYLRFSADLAIILAAGSNLVGAVVLRRALARRSAAFGVP